MGSNFGLAQEEDEYRANRQCPNRLLHWDSALFGPRSSADNFVPGLRIEDHFSASGWSEFRAKYAAPKRI